MYNIFQRLGGLFGLATLVDTYVYCWVICVLYRICMRIQIFCENIHVPFEYLLIAECINVTTFYIYIYNFIYIYIYLYILCTIPRLRLPGATLVPVFYRLIVCSCSQSQHPGWGRSLSAGDSHPKTHSMLC